MNILLQIIVKRLEGGRYTDLLPLVWFPEERYLPYYEIVAADGFLNVVCLGKLLAK